MTHDVLIEELKKALDAAKGLDVELEFQSSLEAQAAKPVTHLLVSFKSQSEYRFIGLKTLLDKLEKLRAKVEGIDLTGSPHNEVHILGHFDEQGFNINIKLS